MKAMQTQVTVIGTFHGAMRSMKNYSPQKLQELLENSNPSVVAAEIRPQVFTTSQNKNSPRDMNEVVIPFCAANNIEIEPIDWWPDQMRSEEKLFFENLQKTKEGPSFKTLNYFVVDNQKF